MVFRNTLPNGLRIVGETMDNYRSVSIGVWIGAGSIYENSAESGAAHFIEHMLFKGTEGRSAARIAEEIDAIGGNLNAFTSKECTCFYVKVLDENIPRALEILADLICNSKLDEADIENEKGVVCEEIAMNQDSPEDLAHETLCQTFFEGDPLADPVLGTEESVNAFKRRDLTAYMDRLYRPDNMVISAAGHFDPEQFTEVAARVFSIGGHAQNAKISYGRPSGGRKLRLIEKDVEQAHICLGFNGFANETEGQYPLYMLNNAIGGSMSSRLFQSIREKKGLAYSVYSAPSFYNTTGYFTLYAGTGEKQTLAVTELMLQEFKNIARNGITLDELERSKNQMRTGYLLGRENTSAHSSAIGRSELLGSKYLSDDEILAKINSVTLDDVMSILPTICDFDNMTAVFVGKVAKYEDELNKLIFGA
ncbi:MAG: insulinase family protein [Christensenellaceae bacterium]|nr:insulinase family protein [Christensenellaceae bacterium]